MTQQSSSGRLSMILDETIRSLVASGSTIAAERLRGVRGELEQLEVQTRAVAVANANMAELYVELEEAKDAAEAREREMVRLERERVAGEALIASVVDALPDALVVLDSDLRVRVWSQAAVRLFGVDHGPSSRIEFAAKHVAASDHDRLLAHLTSPGQGRTEVTVQHATGSQFLAEVVVTPVSTDGGRYHSLRVRDMVAVRQVEAEARQAQKLEAVGRLASGVAHEINTPIQFIGDSVTFVREGWTDLSSLLGQYREALLSVAPAELMASMLAADDRADLQFLIDEAPRAFARTMDGVQRVAKIVQAMKEFAHPEAAEKSSADLNRALASTLTVANAELRHAAEVNTDFGELPRLSCHIDELNQVFLNLMVNAAHAIQDSGKFIGGALGRIDVVTRVADHQVLISISDNGCGIPDSIKNKIYDPFFSTKEVGRGTGQGLSIARSVIAKHGGTIGVDTTVGVGTTFQIRLPFD